jgi:hypothetical protein
MAYKLRLRKIPQEFAVCRLAPDAPLPSWATSGDIWSVTRTPTELSVVCSQNSLPKNLAAERNWVALQVIGPISFGMVGILSSLTLPLADAGVSIFVLSTYETDFILVRNESFEIACRVLTQAGHEIVDQ